jgi:Response regulator containing CheY-like receiver domain and AraC-type DNA-binding domain
MYTYIIVDDESLTRKGTMKKIGTLDNRVQCIGEAENGALGLTLIDELNPDIIITDMNMPVLDGSQFLTAIREKYPSKHIIVISGYKDFEYAKQAIESKALSYILKPFSKEDIQVAINEAIRLMENDKNMTEHIVSIEAEKEYVQYDYDIQMLKNLILGYQTSQHELSSAKLKNMCKLHHIVLMTIHSTEKLNQLALKEYAASNGYGDLGLYIPHLHNDKIGFFVLFFPEKTPLKISAVCKQISSGLIQLIMDNGSQVSTGISAVKDDLLQLNSAYQECVDALNYKQLTDGNRAYFFNEIKHIPIRMAWNNADEFLFRIEASETERVSALLEELFTYLSEVPNCTLYDAKVYSNDLIQNTKIMLSSYYQNSSNTDYSASIQNIFNSIFNFDELKNYLQVLFKNITISMAGTSIYSISDTIEKMKRYIDRNYKKDLSMEFISSLFYMNRSYCSSLFREKTGEKFVDYVNIVRINKAKELLSQTDTKIYQISKSVGYDNPKYFFRIFKKLTGVTPEEFRKI